MTNATVKFKRVIAGIYTVEINGEPHATIYGNGRRGCKLDY